MLNAIISVIIPVYNCEKYLKRCIESVLNQTVSDLELILVDDGPCSKAKVLKHNWYKAK